MLMALRHQQVTKQGKMCLFSKTVIENSALQYLHSMKVFAAETGTTMLQLP